jgi:two-component system response regulator CpxR
MIESARDPAPRILIIDDDVEFCELLAKDLSREHLDVECAADGICGLDRAVDGGFSLIILDVMLPRLNGLEVLRKIRSSSSVPILMLSARGEDIDRIVGLELGADDYLGKPFNPRELLARIHALLRRSDLLETGVPSQLVRIGDVQLNPGKRTVLCSGEPIVLTALEFNMLGMLLNRAGSAVTREDLSRKVLGREFSPIDRSIDIHISRLRRKLGKNLEGEERIKTIRGVGYLYAC